MELKLGGYKKILFLSFLATIITMPEISFSEVEAQKCPVNPAYLEYKQQLKQRVLPQFQDPRFGATPSPIPPEIHQPGQENLVNRNLRNTMRAFPTFYDLRDPNNDGDTSDSLLTPIRDQGTCGVCWTFASFGSLESHLKKNHQLSDSENDYSEDNLKHRHGFVTGPDGACSGGNLEKTAAYLARFDGPISEQDDPYDPSADSEYCTDCNPVRYIDNAVFMPVRLDVNDNNYIKQAVLNYGALHTSLFWDDYFFDSTTNTYYYDDPVDSFDDSNHCVTIVGWDDSKITIGGTGAFIVRNSWGASWGENGYCYVSYNDESIAFSSLGHFIDVDDSEFDFDDIYQYDYFGHTSSSGYNSTIGWGANQFIPSQDGKLQAVGFYATSSNMAYEIMIYDNAIDSGPYKQFSNLLTSQSGSLLYGGYYTVKLNSPVQLIQGDNFIIVIKFDATTAGYNYPIPIEADDPDSPTTANPGESFMSGDGVNFKDITGSSPLDNICIKAFVKNDIQSPEIDIKGNNISIARGDSSPTIDDGTDFGEVETLAGNRGQTFIIYNTGTDDLMISNPLISGPPEKDFKVTSWPSLLIPPDGQTSFEISFFPQIDGLRSATVTIENSDPDENPYTFSIQGNGNTSAVPEMEVRGNSILITDGDATPSSADNTDFGIISIFDEIVSRSFVVYNTGTGTLDLTSFEITGLHNTDFSVSLPPSTTILPGDQTTFTVTFNPSVEGDRSASIEIGNTDTDENPYNFKIQGTGKPFGDVEGDSDVDLGDAIITLKILTGITAPSVNPNTDVDGDQKTGLQEAVYILRKVADLQ